MCVIRSMSATDSGARRPLNPAHAVHFLGMTRMVVDMDRNGGRHGSESVKGEVTLDNPTQVWHAMPGINPGGSDHVTGKVVHAEDQRSITIEMGARSVESGGWAELPHIAQHSQRIPEAC
ncbi:MAG: hypothetical protein IMZ64_11040 [Bacteroidetes bacterium]|nr:hypothetical protein [Bacteroidota bacterium]